MIVGVCVRVGVLGFFYYIYLTVRHLRQHVHMVGQIFF